VTTFGGYRLNHFSGMFAKLKTTARAVTREVKVYRLVLQDGRTPKLAKVLLGLALAYAALPFDLIPDFIPVIGHLDDLIIVPALAITALKLVPQEVVDDCRSRSGGI
jgi:uncharacterized membrane protein YkvA (DUF1232 family)